MSTLQTTILKHPDSASNNIQVDSSGNTGLGGSGNLLSNSTRTTLSLNNTGSSAVALGVNGAREGHIFADANSMEVSATDNDMYFTTGNTESVRIDNSGRLLVGNSSTIPINGQDCALQVEGASAASSRISVINRGNNASGGGIQIAKSRGTIPHNVAEDDQVGGIFWCAGDGTDFASQAARIECYIDDLPGGSDTPGRLVFSTTPNQTDSPVERLRITHSGTLQMGDASNSANGRWVAFMSDPDTANTRARMVLYAKTGTSAGQEIIQIFTGSTEKLRMRADGNILNANDSYGSLSDEKLKENIVDAGSQWTDFKAVRFRKFNFKEETGHETFTQLGVIAQELELTSPGLVYEDADKDQDGNDLGTTTKSVKSSILTKKGLVALQEAMARIEQLEAKVAALEAG